MRISLESILFYLAMTLVVGMGHVYLYRRLFRDTAKHSSWRLAGRVLMGLLATLLTCWWILRYLLPPEMMAVISKVNWFWMAVATYLLLAMLSWGGLRRLTGWLKRRRGAEAAPAPAPAPEVDEERRRFLARTSAGVALAATSGVASYGMWRAFHPPVVNEVAVKLPGLPRALDGFTLIQLSDVHVGPLIQRRFMDAVVEQCNALKGDLMCITGDLVDGSVAQLAHGVGALGNLRSRHGTYFVTGNHEYYSGDEEWTEALTRMGVTVLRNRHVRIGEPGASFDLVGVDDWGARRTGYPRERTYDLAAATAGRDPSRASVLLAHQPAGWREHALKAGMGLQLSGHTHGGQFFPFTLVVSAVWEHDAGLFREGDSHIYVSRGTGFWGPPLRVAAPPEIVKVTLLA
jgi:hypothetical protein